MHWGKELKKKKKKRLIGTQIFASKLSIVGVTEMFAKMSEEPPVFNADFFFFSYRHKLYGLALCSAIF